MPAVTIRTWTVTMPSPELMPVLEHFPGAPMTMRMMQAPVSMWRTFLAHYATAEIDQQQDQHRY